MSEENQEWQAPLPPQDFTNDQEKPQMSLLQTLTGIFIEPSEVFEDLRRKPFPRLVLPFILCAVLLTTYTVSLQLKVGKEAIVKEQLNMKIMESMPEEAKKQMREDAKQPFGVREIAVSGFGFVFTLAIFAVIALVYWGGGLAFGGNGNYWHGLAISAYASFAPILISVVGSLVVLFFKPAEDISFSQSQFGLLKLNPTMFMDGSGVLNAVLTRFDLLVFWGMFLGSVGLQKCFKISAGSAWGISIIIWLIGTAMAALGGMFAG